MKKPEKQVPLCPLIKSECVEEGCKFWIPMERRNIATGAVEKYTECAYIVTIAVITENSSALNRMSEAVCSFRDTNYEAIRNHTLNMVDHLDRGFKSLEG